MMSPTHVLQKTGRPPRTDPSQLNSVYSQHARTHVPENNVRNLKTESPFDSEIKKSLRRERKATWKQMESLAMQVAQENRRNSRLKKKVNTRHPLRRTSEALVSKNCGVENDFSEELISDATMNTKKVHVPEFMDYLRHPEPKECAVCHRKIISNEVCTYCPDCASKPPLCLQPCFRTYHCY